METVKYSSAFAKSYINAQFRNKEPWQIVTGTTTSVLAVVWLWGFLFQPESEYKLVL